MAQVTSGVVEYSRVRKDDDYGIKREAKVSLSFTVDEGESHGAVTERLGADAVARVHSMIQIRPNSEGVVSSGASVAPSATAPATPSEPKVKPGKPPKVDPPKAVEPEGVDDLLGEVEAAVKPVTDQELGAFITRRNAVLKKPDAIRTLVAKYAGPVPKQARDIPQEKRQDFLKELEVLA